MKSNRHDRRIARRQIGDLAEKARVVRSELFATAAALAQSETTASATQNDELRASNTALRRDVRRGIEAYVDALGQLASVDDCATSAPFRGEDEPFYALLADNRWCGATTAEQARETLLEEVAIRSVGKSDLGLLLSSIDHTAYRLYATMPESLKPLRGEELAGAITERLMGEEFDKDLTGDPRWAEMRKRWVKLGWRGTSEESFNAAFVRAAAERTAEIWEGDSVDSGFAIQDTILDERLQRERPEMRQQMIGAFAARLGREWEDILRRRAQRVDVDTAGSCPFCGKTVSVRWGDPPIDPGNLFHALPTCSQYDAMTADEFVRAVVEKNKEGERKLPDGSVEVDVTLDSDEVRKLDRIADRWNTTRNGAMDRIIKERVQQFVPPKVTPADAWAAGKSEADRRPLAYSDHVMMRVGRTLWDVTYALGWSDEQVRDEMATAAAKETEQWPGHQLWPDHLMTFAAKWAVHAFQRIITSHTFAAALMCSDVHRDVLGGIERHWDALLVIVPNGMLVADEFEFSRVLVATYSFGAQMILLTSGGPSLVLPQPRIVVSEALTLADLLASDEADLAAESPTQRCVVMAKRLVAGLLLNLQHPPNFKVKKVEARPKSKGREAEPEHRIVTVGKPLEIDCRESVKEYIDRGKSGRKHAPPSVQVMVRGHYRNQACGVGRMDRKVLWIEPYWRGPEAALIQTRAKVPS